MTKEQIISLAELCKAQSVGQVEQLLSFYKEAQIAELAEHFKCENTISAVAECLANGTTETDLPVSEEIDDLPLDDEPETEEETDSEAKAETPAEKAGKATKKAESKPTELSPYEKIILAEMERRAQDGDTLLADALKSKDKSIKECFSYVTKQARKQAKNGCAMIADDIVYGWAHHYYIESKETIDKEMAPAPTTKPTATAPAKGKDKGKDKPKPVKNTIDFSKIVTAKKADTDGKKGKKREKKKDNLLAGFIPMERPDLETYEKDAKKGSREQAKSVEQMDLFADFFS